MCEMEMPCKWLLSIQKFHKSYKVYILQLLILLDTMHMML